MTERARLPKTEDELPREIEGWDDVADLARTYSLEGITPIADARRLNSGEPVCGASP